MTGLCAILATGFGLLVPGDSFQLVWTHSVEKVEWQEAWRIEDGRLILEQASVAGSGAGMEPPPEAVLQAGRWVWRPGLVVSKLVLARSDFTADWRLCAGGSCRELPDEEDGQTTLVACPQ